MGVIRRLATQEGYEMVVDKQAVPYVRNDLDVTDRVITLYNQGAGDTEGGKAPAADKKAAPGPSQLALPNANPPALGPKCASTSA